MIIGQKKGEEKEQDQITVRQKVIIIHDGMPVRPMERVFTREEIERSTVLYQEKLREQKENEEKLMKLIENYQKEEEEEQQKKEEENKKKVKAMEKEMKKVLKKLMIRNVVNMIKGKKYKVPDDEEDPLYWAALVRHEMMVEMEAKLTMELDEKKKKKEEKRNEKERLAKEREEEKRLAKERKEEKRKEVQGARR
ncbi:protein MNN4-like [Rana temporaria]|uniref:protein MNN4-like n=1 Tax=Rana temporaria TaxID=8407 RepID=UPI001AAC5E0C|nr:protein MNN4-like [Rana temporaria]